MARISIHTLRLHVVLLAVLTLLVLPAATETAFTAQHLKQRFSAAEPDSVIRLGAGLHGAAVLKGGGGAPGRPVTITSADPADPARLVGLHLQDVAHVVFEDIVLDYVFRPGDDIKARPFRVSAGRDVTFRRVIFDGDLARGMDATANGFPAGFGLSVDGADGIVVEDSEVRGFWRGLSMRESRGIDIRGNDLHSLRMDGMNFAQIKDLVIERNRIRDFDRSPDSADHADMIQFWTAHTTEPSRNIIIRGNLMNSGDGFWTQSIFMRNDQVDTGQAGQEMYWRDVTIEDNLIINAHAHAIVLGASLGARISNNTLVHNPGSDGDRNSLAMYRPLLTVSPLSRDVVIEGNIANEFRLPETLPKSWTVRDNLAVQDIARMQPVHYSTVFVGGDPADPAAYRPLPGGVLDGAALGAPLEPWLR
ncbi:hypothetical protein OCH239_12720 [Roseivivax halodurans JCM 10272]|uniref:Right handed beta helix domain-containing protein n=1 Tax=Roseivivax halodurans JCM 10272 TaxID=1449350 RepID=X7EBJ1_9RHOB|nr:right-handed parallel beta-helix repeat-containing protein [Roseivivax halodurans]ETX13235.1 hypothetical protein OCH239_12720 [Roseivivax halodurans JCM 10272]